MSTDADPGEPAPADEPSRPSLSGALKNVALVGSPLAAGTALLYYFGWVRTARQARALGYDTTVLDLGTTDYLLKSVNVLFVPIVALLLLTLLAYQAHRTMIDRRWPQWSVTAVGRAWMAVLTIGIVLFFGVPSLDAAVLPLAITATCGAALYGGYVKSRKTSAPPASRLVTGLLLALLGLAVFWDVEVAASAFGTDFAANIAARREFLPAATVYGKDRLMITGFGVSEVKLTDTDTAYHYRYQGLLFLQRSDDRYFLLAVSPDTASSKLVIVKESDTIRVELG